LGFLGAATSALLVEGQIGLVSFVAFVNFTAGMWICQSIHSLGSTARASNTTVSSTRYLNYVR